MPRYFFHIRRPDAWIEDWEGDVFDTPAEAEREAIKAARDLVIIAIRAERPIDDDEIEIYDETGAQLGTVRLVDVIPRHRR